MNAVERVTEYSPLQAEAEGQQDVLHVPPEWPSRGAIEVQDLVVSGVGLCWWAQRQLHGGMCSQHCGPSDPCSLRWCPADSGPQHRQLCTCVLAGAGHLRFARQGPADADWGVQTLVALYWAGSSGTEACTLCEVCHTVSLQVQVQVKAVTDPARAYGPTLCSTKACIGDI